MWVLSEGSRLDHLQVAIHDGSEMIRKKKQHTDESVEKKEEPHKHTLTLSFTI